MKKIVFSIFILLLFANCQKEREDIFGKSKETRKKERDCDPVLTFLICESHCINNPNNVSSCETAKGSCYIQRNNLCTGSNNM
ncbi:hypothetical protein EHQ82_06735 [Leptospira selangorensis]|uniref:Cys-rich protein n=1 Tax=Leptospira selangorensis TaxID=2484982 RepID=A0ABY2NF77_9LEPT|nr:hypothetical protein [Leptospira selangorensis]TGM22826.1 hypothetical protein EHQ82_06735 [Leptospira selangorensis]